MPTARSRRTRPLVLLVEDEDDTRETLAELLSLHGYDVEPAPDGEQSLEWLRKSRAKPAVILLDLILPVMNGWRFRELQLEDPGLAGIPIVIVTGIGGARDLEARLRPAAVLPKPVDPQRLLEVVAGFR